MHAHAQQESFAPDVDAEPKAGEKVVCTDIIGHPYGLVKVLGEQGVIATQVFLRADPNDMLMLTAYQPNGQHISIFVRQSSISLIGRESEEPIFTEEDLAGPSSGPSAFEGDEVLEVGG